MKIKMAHLRERSKTGGWINFAVFAAKPTGGGNDGLLARLTLAARANGLKVDQSALAFKAGGRTKFYGDKNLVDYLSKNGIWRWTHSLTI
jgi:hypothetical protein